jgi:hypothetical protein
MDMNCSESAIGALNKAVLDLCMNACANARANKRKTIKGDDFVNTMLSKFIEGEEVNCSPDSGQAFLDGCETNAKRACSRARANKRKRLIPQDFDFF